MTHCILSSDRNKKRDRETQFVEHRLFKCAAGASYKIETPSKEKLLSESFDTPTKTECLSRRRKAISKNLYRGKLSDKMISKRSCAHIDSLKKPMNIAKKNSKRLKADTLEGSLKAKKILPAVFEHEELLISPTTRKRPHPIFEVKEVLENIIRFLDRREPSTEEALYARQVKRHSTFETETNRGWQRDHASSVKSSEYFENSCLHNCLMVNKMWHTVTLNLLFKEICFRKSGHFEQFLVSYAKKCDKIGEPSSFILQNFPRSGQKNLNKIGGILNPDKIKWLEFYMCPYIIPPASWVSNFRSLERLIFPGNKLIDDRFLIEISFHTPNLRILDLRACDNMSDSGMVAVALKCPNLNSCNLGRRRCSQNITSVTVLALAKHTQIETLGLAGCNINDSGLWELARIRGKHVKRLSLNSCNLLTNNSLPLLFESNYFPNMLVLEIKNIPQIDDLRHIARYKNWKKCQGVPVLIDGCQRISCLLGYEEAKLNEFYLSSEREKSITANMADNGRKATRPARFVKH